MTETTESSQAALVRLPRLLLIGAAAAATSLTGCGGSTASPAQPPSQTQPGGALAAAGHFPGQCDLRKIDWANFTFPDMKPLHDGVNKCSLLAPLELDSSNIVYADLRGDAGMTAFVPVEEQAAEGQRHVFVYDMDAQCRPRYLGSTGGSLARPGRVIGEAYVFERQAMSADGNLGPERVEARFVRGAIAETSVTHLESWSPVTGTHATAVEPPSAGSPVVAGGPCDSVGVAKCAPDGHGRLECGIEQGKDGCQVMRWSVGEVCACSAGPDGLAVCATGSAAPAAGGEALDQAALLGAKAPAATPVPDAQIAGRYGAGLDDTLQKYAALRTAVTGLDGAFFARRASRDRNSAVRLPDGTEVLLMSGCRNMFLCGETGYVVGCDFAHRQVGLIEVTNAGTPRSYRYTGSVEPALRALVLERAGKAFARAAADPDRAAMNGVKVSATTRAMQGLFQAKPALLAQIRHVYPAANSLVEVEDICGVQMADGRLLTLMSAVTSNADGAVAHAIATDDKTKQTFVYRAESRLGKEAWFGDPQGPLRTVLSVSASTCTNLRAKLGLDPNGQETTVAK